MSGRTAGIRLGYDGKEAAEKGGELLNNFFTGFPEVKTAIDDSKAFLKENGYVEDFLGRRRRLDDINLNSYEAKYKVKPEIDPSFNPFFGCIDRVAEDDPVKIWQHILDSYIILSNALRLVKVLGKPEEENFEANKEMSNYFFDDLKKIAARPELLNEKVKDKKNNDLDYTKLQKMLKDFKHAENVVCFGYYTSYGNSKLVSSNAQMKALIDWYNSKYHGEVPKTVPTEPVTLFAWTGRIAQASRQCFNARIQGCLSADTLISTKEYGLIDIGSLANKDINVWDGKNWSSAIVLPSGKKQKCILTTNIGSKIICSPDHKFLVVNTAGGESFKKLSELKLQDRLVITEDYATVNIGSNLRTLINQDYNTCHNKNNYSFDDIKDDYIRGQVLGRIASDGSYVLKKDGSGYVYILVAEHEQELLEFFKKVLPYKYSIQVNQKKNQKVYSLVISSKALATECKELNIKHDINNYFYQNTECLRGFISGFFDGDGTALYEHLQLDFGKQADFTIITNKMRQALLFFGIKSTVANLKDRFRLSVRKHEASLFASRIGFITSSKQQLAGAIRTKHTNLSFNNRVIACIKDIIITDEFIEMYDVCNTERGYFVANGLVTHNSAASLTKLAMVDIYNDKVMNDCQAKLIIPVHDELLVECPAYYASIVEKRLPEIMIEAAKRGGDDVPQSCDPYTVTRWASDVCAAFVLDEYKKLEAKSDRDTALIEIKRRHPEVPEGALMDVLLGKVDELIF